VINEFGARNVSRLFSTPEGQLTQLQTAAERTAGVELAYLTNYYVLDLAPSASAENAARLVNELNRLDSVEIAYIAPVPENAQSSEPTPDYAPKQGYLMPAPKGIDAQYAWQHTGGRGEGMRFADIEYGWLLAHEDLPKTLFLNGKNSSNTDFKDHGTAVLGEIVAVDNGRGVTGIANRARFAVVSQQRTDDHRSVADATSRPRPPRASLSSRPAAMAARTWMIRCSMGGSIAPSATQGPSWSAHPIRATVLRPAIQTMVAGLTCTHGVRKSPRRATAIWIPLSPIRTGSTPSSSAAHPAHRRSSRVRRLSCRAFAGPVAWTSCRRRTCGAC
jgi:hypothetical protein